MKPYFRSICSKFKQAYKNYYLQTTFFLLLLQHQKRGTYMYESSLQVSELLVTIMSSTLLYLFTKSCLTCYEVFTLGVKRNCNCKTCCDLIKLLESTNNLYQVQTLKSYCQQAIGNSSAQSRSQGQRTDCKKQQPCALIIA